MPAILVLKDIPKFCVECPLIHLGDRFICKATNRWCGDEKGFFTSETKPTWCPLRPLPHKLQADWYTDGYKEGFNACLDAITNHIGESTEKVCNDDLYESWMFFDEGETEQSSSVAEQVDAKKHLIVSTQSDDLKGGIRGEKLKVKRITGTLRQSKRTCKTIMRGANPCPKKKKEKQNESQRNR